MTVKDRTALYLDYLRKEGFNAEMDADGDVKFKYEGKTYYFILDKEDEEFFRLVFPNFWSLDGPAERAKAEKAAFVATSATKVAKVLLVGDNVWAMIEMFVSDPAYPTTIFPRSMSALRYSVSTFVEEMNK